MERMTVLLGLRDSGVWGGGSYARRKQEGRTGACL